MQCAVGNRASLALGECTKNLGCGPRGSFRDQFGWVVKTDQLDRSHHPASSALVSSKTKIAF
jgi:hypothetical protein